MTLTTRQPRISPWLGIPLSIFMILISAIILTDARAPDATDWPVLTTIRDKDTHINVLNHRANTTPPWLYKGAKATAAILWSILIPMQHSQLIRRNNLQFHRLTGYIVILLSIDLGLAGYYMSSQGFVTTHKNWYHIHSFYGTPLPIPLLFWPTFDGAIAFLGVFYFYSLYKLLVTIRGHKIESHRRWAVFHSMTGYAISIERLVTMLVFTAGWILHFLPQDIQDGWLRLPQDVEGKVEVEMSALAWTLAAAGVIVAAWACFEFVPGNGVQRKANLAEDKKLI